MIRRILLALIGLTVSANAAPPAPMLPVIPYSQNAQGTPNAWPTPGGATTVILNGSVTQTGPIQTAIIGIDNNTAALATALVTDTATITDTPTFTATSTNTPTITLTSTFSCTPTPLPTAIGVYAVGTWPGGGSGGSVPTIQLVYEVKTPDTITNTPTFTMTSTTTNTPTNSPTVTTTPTNTNTPTAIWTQVLPATPDQTKVAGKDIQLTQVYLQGVQLTAAVPTTTNTTTVTPTITFTGSATPTQTTTATATQTAYTGIPLATPDQTKVSGKDIQLTAVVQVYAMQTQLAQIATIEAGTFGLNSGTSIIIAPSYTFTPTPTPTGTLTPTATPTATVIQGVLAATTVVAVNQVVYTVPVGKHCVISLADAYNAQSQPQTVTFLYIPSGGATYNLQTYLINQYAGFANPSPFDMGPGDVLQVSVQATTTPVGVNISVLGKESSP